MNVVVYRLAFDKGFQKAANVDFDVGIGFMLLFQAIHLTFIIVTSVKLTKQVMHRTASGWFLAQSYLSTILLFAGIYTLVERIVPASFRGLYTFQDELSHELVFIRFLYFSTTTMTTVGYGDISSDQWYTDIIVMTQMLLSVLYTTVIFSKGLSHFSGSTLPYVHKHHNSSRNRADIN